MPRAWRDFHASLYALVTLASVMLGAAEGAWLPAALTPPIAIAAYVAVERRRALALPDWMANGLGLLAIGVALAELAARDVEGRILFGAHLLTYLSWVFLWQRKGDRQRWGLLALAVLQVAVGSVLTTAVGYGLGMVAFLVATVRTLAVLQIAQSGSLRDVAPAAPAADPPRWGGQSLLGHGTVLAAGSSGPDDFQGRHLGPPVVVTVAAAAVVGAAFFLLVPRYELGRRPFRETDEPLSRQRVTGFTERVKLGSFGQILESSTPVFEVRVTDTADTIPLPVPRYASTLGREEPLFRGLTLDSYDRGEWTAPPESRVDPYFPLQSLPLPGAIRQDYRLWPAGTQVLFTLAPPHAAELGGTDEPIRMRWSDGTLRRPSRMTGTVAYTAYAARASARTGVRGDTGWRLPPRLRQRYLDMPPGLDGLRRVAGTAVGTPETRADGPPVEVIVADRLVSHLRDSGEFGYSLSSEIDDPRLDPIEDFLLNRKSGHCEYFAAALALMLRAEGVPSRVVNGYKGGEVNPLTGAWEVQQRHAHAWVEAFYGGRWQTLDPTPAAARSRSVQDHAPRSQLASNLWAAAGDFWRGYVVTLNISRQRELAAPFKDWLTDGWQAVSEEFWPTVKRAVVGFATRPERWFSWEGAAVTFVLLLAGVGLHRLMRRLRGRGRRRGHGPHGRRGPTVEFYERFRRACDRRGWSAGPGQTPREFAAALPTDPAAEPLPADLVHLPADLTEAFYHVRFGGVAPPPDRLRDLERRLTAWETAVSR